LIVGNGIDVVRIDRISLNLSRKILTERERKVYDDLKTEERKKEFLAGRFAAKEAFFKAIGSGIGKYSFLDISILNDENGGPFILVERDFNPLFNYGYVSISHDFVAVASVILEKVVGGVIADSQSNVCTTIKSINNGLYELDCNLPPFKLWSIFKKKGINLVKYGNIWEANYFEHR